ncbi:MAG: hypothetical protein JST14_02370 [Bacteroidetes bacterium]|nr:hypothetical protein [Bacteroidota bacterium]
MIAYMTSLRIPLLILLIPGYSAALAQTFTTENAQLKGWLTGNRLTLSDFRGRPDDQFKRLNREGGLQATAKVAIRSVMDVPKKKKDRATSMEKVYISPFFYKLNSISVTKDEHELDKQRLLFDLAEWFSRMARQEFAHLLDSAHHYGVIWLMYSRVMNKYCIGYQNAAEAYSLEVVAKKDENAFQTWRRRIDQGLKETQSFATTPKDCHRLLTNLTIDESYEPAEDIGSFVGCN